MKVIEHLERAKEPLISFEIIPPLRGGDVRNLMVLIEDLVPFRPPFIDITSHAAEVFYEETPAGIQRRVKRKRPGTMGVCALIQNKYGIDAVPHVLCRGFTREETEDFLIELRYLGIDNVLAVRGDDSGYEKPLREGQERQPLRLRPGDPDRRHEPRPLPRRGSPRRRAARSSASASAAIPRSTSRRRISPPTCAS